MKRIFSYLIPFRAAIALEMVIKILGTLAELLLPWMLQVILDEFVPAKQMDAILLWGGGMVLCAAALLIVCLAALSACSDKSVESDTSEAHTHVFGTYIVK